jgi:hypothetical protein
LEQTNFKYSGKKESGITEGFIAKDKQGNTFILKQFFKDEKHAPERKDLDNRRDNVQELVTGTMYQFLLYDRAPKIELVRPDKANENSLYIRSKYFTDVVSLSQFSLPKKRKLKNGDFGAANPDLKKVEGFEKVVAACHILGEADYHANNLLVQNGKTLTKIDHGRSFMETFNSFEEMAKNTYDIFRLFRYNEAIRNGNLSFNARVYAESLNNMVKQLSDDQIDAIVDRKIYELKKAGFNPKGLDIYPSLDKHVKVQNFDELRDEYKNIAKTNRANMQKIAEAAEIIDKLDVVPQFKNGGWLEALASKKEHPVQYAMSNNIKIDGQDPVRWALKKGNFEKLPKNVQAEAKLNKPIDLVVKQTISRKTGQFVERVGGFMPDRVKQERKGAKAHSYATKSDKVDEKKQGYHR